MMALMGGLVAIVIGIVWLVVSWSNFVEIFMGVIPVMLILGGALTTYFGFDQMVHRKTVEVYDPIKNEFRHEIDTLKEELKELKDKMPS